MARAKTVKTSKKTTKKRSPKHSTLRAILTNRYVHWVGFAVAIALALGAIALSVYWMPSQNNGRQAGVGADGFSVRELKGVDLGVANVVSKDVIVKELGQNAKAVGNVNKSGTISLNGNRGQTATYYFKSQTDGRNTIYVDVLEYQSKSAYESDNVFKNTADGGEINGLPVRYMKAATIAGEREYALLVTKGLNSYKFAITQPVDNIAIVEKTALETLKRIAAQADL